ncbi:MAG: tripartite tricarboxylate transporter substrate binding protein [Burkholderiales bacterium]|nr:tripartite tricarboxylate transporter substrate binding protein [Burkholderiales bacterium]
MRKILELALALATLTPLAINAQSPYPNKAIKIVVPFPAGGVADIVARTIGVRLAENIGQSVLVENRAGASAIIGTEFVAKSVPDGYTLLLANLPVLAINPIAYTKLPYEPLKDFAPISMVTDQPYIIGVNPSIPAKDLKEFIALAKQNRGKFTHGSASSSTHLATELFKLTAGIEALHVPYKGSAPAINDLLGGQITFLIDPVITMQPFVKSGKVRALAVTDSKRSAAAPDVPSYTEFGLKDLDMTSWQGLVAPAGTPKDVIARLHREIVKVLQNPEVIERLKAQGVTPVGSSPEAFTAFVQREVARWSKVASDVKFEKQSQ